MRRRFLILLAAGWLWSAAAALAQSESEAEDAALPPGVEAEVAALETEAESRLTALEEFGCSLDDPACLSEELTARFEADQWFRFDFFGEDGPCAALSDEDLYRVCWRRMWDSGTKIDRDNFDRVAAILDRHDWPVGAGWSDEAETAVWFIVQHSPVGEGVPDLMGRILPKVKESFEVGRLTGWHYAAMYDRHRLRNDGKQTYGTQFRCEDGAWINPNLGRPETVDDRRAELGMEPVAEKAAKMGECRF